MIKTSDLLPRAGLALLAVALIGACSDQTGSQHADRSADQRDLSHGWAQLFETADGLSGINKLLYVKLETQAVDDFVSGLADDMGALASRVEQVTAGTPWIDLGDNGLPRIELEKRSSSQFDRALGLAPVFGRTGTDFERTLLLTLSGGLNQSRYLTRVMLEMETDPARVKVLEDAKATFDRLYDADVDLLNARYFCSSEARNQPVTDDAASRDFDGDEGGDSANVRADTANPGGVTTQAEQNAEAREERDEAIRSSGPRGKGKP